MRRPGHRLRMIIWILFVVFIVSIIFTIVFYMDQSIFNVFNMHPSFFIKQFINSFIGLLLAGFIMNLIGKIARKRGWFPERHVFKPLFDAIDQITSGDFSIQIKNDFRENPFMSELTTRVNKMALELGQMENMRQEFISNVSHEIQSPLTSIRGFAEILDNENLNFDERHHYLDIIINESSRLSKLSDNLLKLASFDAETVKLIKKSYRLDHQIKNLIIMNEPQWRAKNLTIDVELDKVNINADEEMLNQVWINLISNAIKFTPDDGLIEIKLSKKNDDIEFIIKDSGIGIPEEEVNHIFERFYKVDKSRKRTQKGSGLGLSIVKKIIDVHKGKIEVNSQLEKGTMFTITLPVE